jgi:hypothetical protein
MALFFTDAWHEAVSNFSKTELVDLKAFGW